MNKTLIILGTAHLSSTAGKRSPDGAFREYRYSREICTALQRRLIESGYDCVIDYPDADMPGKTSSQELAERCRIVNDLARKREGRAIYVSIHINAASSGQWNKATGWEIYTSKGVTKADALATSIYNAAREHLKGKKMRVDFTDGDADKEENFYVLRHTTCPAVLTENFFQDNREDVAFLLSEEGREAIVQAHYDGIINYLK